MNRFFAVTALVAATFIGSCVGQAQVRKCFWGLALLWNVLVTNRLIATKERDKHNGRGVEVYQNKYSVDDLSRGSVIPAVQLSISSLFCSVLRMSYYYSKPSTVAVLLTTTIAFESSIIHLFPYSTKI